MRPAGCLILALVQALANTAGAASVDNGCQTSTLGHVEGLNKRLLHLEDSYMTKVRWRTLRMTLVPLCSTARNK